MRNQQYLMIKWDSNCQVIPFVVKKLYETAHNIISHLAQSREVFTISDTVWSRIWSAILYHLKNHNDSLEPLLLSVCLSVHLLLHPISYKRNMRPQIIYMNAYN